MADRKFGIETLCLHAGQIPDPATGARAAPIYQTTSFVFDSAEHAASLFNLQKLGFIYSRLTNPTVSVLEERIASLEGGVGAIAAASGHGAQLLALFPFMEPGAEIVAANKLYGGSINQLGNSFKRAFGWTTHFVDVDDPDTIRRAANDKTRAIFVESLANPGGVVSDLEAIAAVARELGVPLIVDNTMATPYLCRPIEHGADIVVHSTTKFLSGNGTSIGGVVVDSGRFNWAQSDKFKGLTGEEPGYHGLRFHETFGDLAYTFYGHAVGLRDLGVNQQPLNAFLTLLGIETLSLRMDRHMANTRRIVEFLVAHPFVSRVGHPLIESHPSHALAQKLLRHGARGAGAVFSFDIKGSRAQGKAFIEALKLFSHLANVGDCRSLVIHPASTTHFRMTDEALAGAGISQGTIRLSIGLEDPADLIDDLKRALKAAEKAGA